jgi:hypothetical protein
MNWFKLPKTDCFVMHLTRYVCAIAIVAVTNAHAVAGDSVDWRCPYRTDCSCPPNRSNYGYNATKWRRWPGVSDPVDEPTTPNGPPPSSTPAPKSPEETAPTVPGDEMLLPPGEKQFQDRPDSPPEDTRNIEVPKELEEDLLAPPSEEDFKGMALPDEPAAKKPEKDAPKARPSNEPPAEKRPVQKETPPPIPEERTPEPPSDDEDPFKDDPLFNDEAPEPPPGEKPVEKSGESWTPPKERGAVQPAMREVPQDLPAVQTQRPELPLSKLSIPEPSRLTPVLPVSHRPSSSTNPLRTSSIDDNTSASNPLRSSPTAAAPVAHETNVVRTAAWEPTHDVRPRVDERSQTNPLRRR